ncbi:MAG: sulfatase [Acidobacteriota bacterium]
MKLHRGVTYFALAVLLSVLVTWTGCARSDEIRREVDWVIGQGLRSSLSGGEPAPFPCADETRFSRRVRAGEELVAEIAPLGRDGRWVLSGCRRGESTGALQLAAWSGDSLLLEESLPLAGTEGWWHHEVDLSGYSGKPLRLVLRADFEGPRRLFLSDFRLQHRLAVPPVSPPERSPVLLISVDTLRHDRAARMASLERLAADGEVFAPHYAAASWTKPSHGALLTGRLAALGPTADPEGVLPAEVETLAERFRAAGYRTAGLVYDCTWLDPKFGFDRGFESYRTVRWRTAPLVREALDWITDHRGEPFFYFLHTFEPHSDHARLPYEGQGVTAATVEERFGVPGYGCRQATCAAGLLEGLERGRIAPLPEEPEILRFLYDAGVAATDEALGHLFDRLRELGLYDAMTIVVTSDHGELLFEHGELTHGKWWEEVVRVPLIIKWPASGERAGRVNEVPSSAIDLVPTLLAKTGLPGNDLDGVDLQTRRADRPVTTGVQWRTVRVENLKAIFPLDEPPRLYDLAADPGEANDLAPGRPEAVDKMRELLEKTRASAQPIPEAESERAPLSEEEKARLRALGYLGG